MYTNKICPDQSKKGSKVLQDRTVTLGLVLRLDARKWWWWSILLKLDVRSILIRFDGGGPKTRPRYFLYGLSPSYTIGDKFCLFGGFFKLFVCFRVGNVVAITNIYIFLPHHLHMHFRTVSYLTCLIHRATPPQTPKYFSFKHSLKCIYVHV